MKYGIITPADEAVLDFCLDLAIQRFGRLKVCEIGVEEGRTARGIHERCGGNLDYWGVDNRRDLETVPPFPDATLILGDSMEVHPLVPEGLNFLIVDGCHCFNHVVCDFLNFSPKVVPGGILLFHDTAPAAQGAEYFGKSSYQGHGPKDHPLFGVAVRAGLKALWNLAGWKQIKESESAPDDWGGFIAYERE